MGLTLSPQIAHDNHARLALVLIARSVHDVECYLDRNFCFESKHYKNPGDAEREAEKHARVAIRWLLGTSRGRCGLSFDLICQAFGWPTDQARALILSRWQRRQRRLDRLVAMAIPSARKDA